MTSLVLHAFGLLVFPGLIAAIGAGLLLEVGAAVTLVPARGGLGPAARAVLAPLRAGARAGGFPLLSLLAIVLALVAAVQVAAPYNPVPAGDRNLVTAAFALVGAGWLLWTWGWGSDEMDPRLMVAIQLCWLVALLVPAVVPQTFKPQTLGNTSFNPHLPVKVACGLIYLMCLPALLHLLPESAPQGVPGASTRRAAGSRDGAGFAALRVLLWLPYCGLFASLYFPPGGEDPLDLLRFAAVACVSAAVAVLIAQNLIRRGAGFTHRFYLLVVVPFAWITVGLGMLSAAIGTT